MLRCLNFVPDYQVFIVLFIVVTVIIIIAVIVYKQGDHMSSVPEDDDVYFGEDADDHLLDGI